MDTLTASPVFQAYVVTTIVLGFNLLVLANNTALSRASAGEAVNPEDRALNREAKIVYEAGNPRTERYRRAHRNALENLPLFIITGLVLTFTSVPFTVAVVLFAVFVIARITHSVSYLFEKQPWRTASFAIGAIDQAVLLGVLGYYTFMG